MVDGLLRQESSRSQHGQTTVLELLRLHDFELRRISGLQTQGIKAQVAWGVVLPEEAWFSHGVVRWLVPSLFGAELFGTANAHDQEEPEHGRDLGDVVNGRTVNHSVEKNRATRNAFTDQEAHDSEHADASMGNFGLAVAFQGCLVSLVGKSERVEESNCKTRKSKACVSRARNMRTF